MSRYAACSVDGCERRAYKRGFCNMHYLRVRKNGHPGGVEPLTDRRPSPCSVDGCDGVVERKGLCVLHDARVRRGRPVGMAEATVAAPVRDAEDFYSRVEQGDGCWDWVEGGSGASGYGRACGDHAHRVSWRFAYGPIPEGLWVLHTCDNRKCVRPDHLFLGTNLTNIADMVAKGRHCRGEVNGMSKLTDASVREIRSSGLSAESLAAMYDVTKAAIRLVLRRETWRHVV